MWCGWDVMRQPIGYRMSSIHGIDDRHDSPEGSLRRLGTEYAHTHNGRATSPSPTGRQVARLAHNMLTE